MGAVDLATGVGFSVAARRLADEARRRGLVVPGFRSPPRLAGARRTLRRHPDAAPLVSVERRGRLADEVVADMVDGVVAANGLTGAAADDLRKELHAAVASVEARVA